MIIAKEYISPRALDLIKSNPLAECAYNEVANSIWKNVTPGHDTFILNNTGKNCNGVVPVKERCYQILEDEYGWYREKPLLYFRDNVQKGGPIDVYKEFYQGGNVLYVGLEFETGNISSAHRSMNKLRIGLVKEEITIAFLMMPIKAMSFY